MKSVSAVKKVRRLFYIITIINIQQDDTFTIPEGDKIAALMVRDDKDHTEISLGSYIGRAEDEISRHHLN